MATHSNILAWRTSRTEEPGGHTVHRVAKSRAQESNKLGLTESFFSREQARTKEVAAKLFAEKVGLFQGKPPDAPSAPCLPQLKRVVKCQLTKLLGEQ